MATAAERKAARDAKASPAQPPAAPAPTSAAAPTPAPVASSAPTPVPLSSFAPKNIPPAAAPPVPADAVSVNVVATEVGFYIGRRRVGARFAYALKPGAKLPKWMRLASDPAPVAAAPAVPVAPATPGDSSSSVI